VIILILGRIDLLRRVAAVILKRLISLFLQVCGTWKMERRIVWLLGRLIHQLSRPWGFKEAATSIMGAVSHYQQIVAALLVVL